MSKWENEHGTEYRNEYRKQSYDLFQLVLPKGKREEYKDYAKSKGKSLSAYINDLVIADIEKGE